MISITRNYHGAIASRNTVATIMKRTSVLITLLGSVALALAAGLFLMAPAKGSPVDPAIAKGRWLTESGNLEIDISPCGDKLCGVVSRVISSRSMSRSMSSSGEKTAPADDEALLAMKILSDFAVDADGSWRGKIYNRDNGKTYDCIMRGQSPEKLEIRAYKFLPVFGKTQIWTRVAETTEAPRA